MLPYYYAGNGNKIFIGFSSNAGGSMKYIDFVTESELLYGTADNVFSPDTNVSRAMFASIIGRLYERSYLEIKAGENAAFTDCDYNEWYGNYIDWCRENGIILGRSDTIFDPDSSITREEAAVILYRFTKFLGFSDKGAGETELKFANASDISAWAADAALYCQNAGVIVGRGSERFNPKSIATRSEISSMLARFIQAVV